MSLRKSEICLHKSSPRRRGIEFLFAFRPQNTGVTEKALYSKFFLARQILLLIVERYDILKVLYGHHLLMGLPSSWCSATSPKRSSRIHCRGGWSAPRARPWCPPFPFHCCFPFFNLLSLRPPPCSPSSSCPPSESVSHAARRASERVFQLATAKRCSHDSILG